MDKVLLSHGDGGTKTWELINKVFLKNFGTKGVSPDDSTRILLAGSDVLITTDSFVVDPIFFPGGDIGSLAVYGTLNDLWVSGAIPMYLTSAFIIEEGTDIVDLQRIAGSMGKAAGQHGIAIVAGDTKVVPRGKGDKVFISMSGVGVKRPGLSIERRALPGDRVLVSGTLGEHGAVILAHRLGIPLGRLTSDSGPVGSSIDALVNSGSPVHMMRDPTRGGLASALNEVAAASSVNITVYEKEIPVSPEVSGLCDLLGVSPLYLPCEGRVVAMVGQGPVPHGWFEIGRVDESPADGKVFLQTMYGGKRRLGMFEGTSLPRIC